MSAITPTTNTCAPTTAVGALRPVVFRWDLDKTYLRTEFDRLVDLVKTALEKAEDKRAVPGAPELLRALTSRPGSRVTFVSGSPRQMRKKLAKKLALDGINVDQLILKPNLENALKGRFRALREQVGYKLPALLTQRLKSDALALEVCFGDDAEADAFVYRLYGEVVSGAVPLDVLPNIMRNAGAYDDQILTAVDLAQKVRAHQAQAGAEGLDPVTRVIIHLDGKSPPAKFAPFGDRVVPIYNYLQAALVLHADGWLSGAQVVHVGQSMADNFGYDVPRLANAVQDLVRRGVVSTRTVAGLQPALEAHVGDDHALYDAFRRKVARIRKHVAQDTPAPVPLDYLDLLERGLTHRDKSAKATPRRGRPIYPLGGE